MAKIVKPTRKTETPRFAPGTSVSTRSLVVDADGIAWWVDAHDQTIAKAEK